MSPLASLLTYGGLAALALAMPRHHRTVYTRDLPDSRRAVLRVTGWRLLTFSLVAAVATHGSEVGIVAWFAGFASAGFALTLLPTYAPRFWPLPLPTLLVLACTISAFRL